MDPEYWRGYHDCRKDLRELLGKNRNWSAESSLVVILAFLIEEDDEILNRQE